jgi:formate dehydrogenase subunit delta
MGTQSLVKMANDIGRFFAAEPRHADAVAGIAAHLQRFWEPRMLRKIAALARAGDSGLEELPREAVLSLKLPDSPAA